MIKVLESFSELKVKYISVETLHQRKGVFSIFMGSELDFFEYDMGVN